MLLQFPHISSVNFFTNAISRHKFKHFFQKFKLFLVNSFRKPTKFKLQQYRKCVYTLISTYRKFFCVFEHLASDAYSWRKEFLNRKPLSNGRLFAFAFFRSVMCKKRDPQPAFFENGNFLFF